MESVGVYSHTSEVLKFTLILSTVILRYCNILLQYCYRIPPTLLLCSFGTVARSGTLHRAPLTLASYSSQNLHSIPTTLIIFLRHALNFTPPTLALCYFVTLPSNTLTVFLQHSYHSLHYSFHIPPIVSYTPALTIVPLTHFYRIQ